MSRIETEAGSRYPNLNQAHLLFTRALIRSALGSAEDVGGTAVIAGRIKSVDPDTLAPTVGRNAFAASAPPVGEPKSAGACREIFDIVIF